MGSFSLFPDEVRPDRWSMKFIVVKGLLQNYPPPPSLMSISPFFARAISDTKVLIYIHEGNTANVNRKKSLGANKNLGSWSKKMAVFF